LKKRLESNKKIKFFIKRTPEKTLKNPSEALIIICHLDNPNLIKKVPEDFFFVKLFH